MKKTFLFLAILTAIHCTPKVNPVSELEQSSPFNFDAATAYFALVDRLSNNEVLSDVDWESFFNLEGNRLFISENNISKSFMKKFRANVELVYIPTNDSLFKAKVDSDMLLQIRREYKENEIALRKHLKWMQGNTTEFQKQIIALTKEYLPKRMHETNVFPKVYYHALFDGSASDAGLFVDVMNDYDAHVSRPFSFVAHELHHYMRGGILEEVAIDSVDAGIIWGLEAIFNEGFADMIDKIPMLAESSDWWMKDLVGPYMSEASSLVVALNSSLLEEANNKHHDVNHYRQLVNGSVGHVPGYFMAKVIYDNNRFTEVIEHGDDPFYFFVLYNEIAKEKGGDYPTLDDTALVYILKLKEKYKGRK